MRTFRLAVDKSYVGGVSSTALVNDEEDPRTEIVREAFDSISTDLHVTVGGVTMFVAAWQDPEHWAEDWAEELEVEHSAVPEAVEALIASAQE